MRKLRPRVVLEVSEPGIGPSGLECRALSLTALFRKGLEPRGVSEMIMIIFVPCLQVLELLQRSSHECPPPSRPLQAASRGTGHPGAETGLNPRQLRIRDMVNGSEPGSRHKRGCQCLMAQTTLPVFHGPTLLLWPWVSQMEPMGWAYKSDLGTQRLVGGGCHETLL